LDASHNSFRSIYILRIGPALSLTFSCFSNYRVGLLRSIQFCCERDGLTPPTCHDLVATASPRRGGLSICPDLPDTLLYSYQLTTGAVLNLTFNPAFQRKSGYNYAISCRLSDANSFLESAPLLLRDAGHFVNHLLPPTTNSTEVLVVNATDPPHLFTCGDFFTADWPAWMTTLWVRLAPFRWGFCWVGEGGITIAACASVALPVLPRDGALLTPEGHLVLFKVEPNSAVVCLSTGTGRALRVFAAETRGSVIWRGLGTPVRPREPISEDIAALSPLSPTQMEYFLLDGGPPPAAPAADFYLLFLYRLARGKPKYTWLHDGRVLQFTQPQEAFAYPLFFRSPSSSVCCLSGVQTVAGSYQLIVSSFVNGRRDPVGSLNFTALVRVLRPARLSCTPSSLASPLLLAEGFPFEVRCEVTPVSEDLQISAELQSMLTGQRTSLDFWHDPSVRTFVVQTAEKKENTRVVVFHKRECLFADGDFRFLLWARNLWGTQYADIVARVFPLPAVTLAPRAVFCSTLCDPSVIEISFKDRLPAVWRDNYAIYPSLSWLLVGRRNQTDVSSDPDLRQFFHVDYDNGSSLRLLPDPAAFNASDLGSLLLAKGLGDPNATTFYLQLRIQLFWDPSEDSGSKRLVVYDTATARIDPALRVLLTFGEKSVDQGFSRDIRYTVQSHPSSPNPSAKEKLLQPTTLYQVLFFLAAEEVSSWLLGTIIGALCLFLILLLGLLLLGLLLRRRQSLRGPRADFPDLSPRPEISYPLERPETIFDSIVVLSYNCAVERYAALEM
uniref:Ig-like domain-containing protein n=1 Tax=Schistocephalus solidus TaxID=70667 RepID=A0A183THP3_SCHSO